MEVPAARRRPNTYGKGARKVLVHDLFDVGTLSSFRPVDRTTTPTVSLEHTRHVQDADNTLCRADPQELYLSSEKKYSIDHASSKPPMARGSSPSETSNASVFDVNSDNEQSTKPMVKRPLKKRKVTPVVRDLEPAMTRVNLEDEREVSSTSNAAVVKKKPQLTTVGGARKPQLQSRSNTRTAVNGGSIQKPTKLQKTTSTLKKREDTILPTLSKSATIVTAPSKALRISSGSSVQVSDESDASQLSRRSTPKRKRVAPEQETYDIPSPSQLEIRSLKLTTDNTTESSHNSSSDEEMTEPNPVVPIPSRGRTRLIDRLDAPPSRSIERTASKPTLGRSVSDSSSPRKTQAEMQKPPPVVPNIGPPARQRATYARQRSHLSDMVDSLEATTNSGPSSQQSCSQPMSFPAISSQLELENDDSDHAETFSQIKSIHELRRGGAISKFDLDIQTILEDVESNTKSLRIQGLLQLIGKLKEPAFTRHFQESGSLHRFADCAKHDLDKISAVLMVQIFQSLVSSGKPSPKILLQILDGLYRLSPDLCSERRTLPKLAKDRSENLTKALVRDISELHERQTEASDQGQRSARLVFLEAINSTLRSLIRLKEPIPPTPRALLKEILASFNRKQAGMQEESDDTEGLESLQVLLSLLEIACANHELAESALSMSRISLLGQSIVGVMTVARQTRPEIQHSCLRLIVSLSNNQPKVCEAMAEGALITTVFKVVDDHFLILAALAAQEKEFDNAQLESVILAVGCLLNLAECADAARERMLAREADGRSMIDRLVDIFNSYVDQASEALTIDQGPILVAFGYISALLCTLCLNTGAWKHISDHIRGKGLSQLFNAADTFLDHLRTVEEALGNDGGSASGFTARFSAVLDALKQQNV
ncbi:hypothetical protein LTR10_015544 [Elasticomyces elasticus]|uniref:Wings apart-like protein C-terminal domain-containing protein n=1 Tax=Exophiala sideris TaxID=1016849 RepID=A0ABR0JKZ5_9EURO|nr:hypothetical protein LTR10_015544 [Elasticomyces elasticus]KAK5032255.1 hypothetical protein LTR13_007473 [Exophiala sideris]KAK5036253.1 hypothetical protein LTS07_001979 [Exophiala sideris]KAK5066636.1 hypothetical protein LTR69_001983 [Exophiala sideris]KAK5180458.1 hypothetical protein LTR44_007216 [Eurotiomycetes sp. CCFEE 6388]